MGIEPTTFCVLSRRDNPYTTPAGWIWGRDKLFKSFPSSFPRRYPEPLKNYKKYSKWGLNPRPSACKADVITTTLLERVLISSIFHLCRIIDYLWDSKGLVFNNFKCRILKFQHFGNWELNLHFLKILFKFNRPNHWLYFYKISL